MNNPSTHSFFHSMLIHSLNLTHRRAAGRGIEGRKRGEEREEKNVVGRVEEKPAERVKEAIRSY
jgi:hypothetical protein